MSEELQSMVQIIELYGRGLGALGHAEFRYADHQRTCGG